MATDPAFSGFLYEQITVAVRNATNQAVTEAAGSLMSGLALGTEGLTDLHYLLDELQKEAENILPPAERLRIHTEAGLIGQRSVLASYDSSRGRSGGPRGYRAGEGRWPRYSGGKLRAALASPEFFEATPDGIRFINTDLLNREAKQWARLNFGAAPAGQGSLPPMQVMMGDTNIGSIGLNEGARPGFMIPRGLWRDGEFHPFGEQATTEMGREASDDIVRTKKPTKGIENRNFLDRGLYTMMGGKAGRGGTSGSANKALPNMYIDALNRNGSKLAQDVIRRGNTIRPRTVRVRRR